MIGKEKTKFHKMQVVMSKFMRDHMEKEVLRSLEVFRAKHPKYWHDVKNRQEFHRMFNQFFKAPFVASTDIEVNGCHKHGPIGEEVQA